jgi:hypothetical protein
MEKQRGSKGMNEFNLGQVNVDRHTASGSVLLFVKIYHYHKSYIAYLRHAFTIKELISTRSQSNRLLHNTYGRR